MWCEEDYHGLYGAFCGLPLVCFLALAVIGAVDIHGIVSRSVSRRALFPTEMSINRGLSI